MACWSPFIQVILRFSIKTAVNFVCYPPQRNSDKDVQFKNIFLSHGGHRQTITASTVLPLLSVAADTRRNCINKLPWMNALKRSRTQSGLKITFSLMTNLKQGTLDMCKSAAGRCVCVRACALSRPGTEGLSFWLMCNSSTQLAFLCSCSCRYFGQYKRSQSWARSVFIDQNLANVGGYTQRLQLIRVIQKLTLEEDSVTDGQGVVQQFE